MVTTTNLEAYWTLDEASGTIYDSTDNDVDSTSESVTYGATGKINDCLDFESGSTNSINFGDVASLDFAYNDAFSISLWVKFESTSNANFLVTKQGSGTPDNKGWGVSYDSSNRLEFAYADTGEISVRKTTTLSTGTWYHLVFTYDGSSNASGVNIYVNGSAQTSLTTAADTLTGGTGTSHGVALGTRGAGAYGYLDGLLDEVAVFSRELSQQDVTDLYNSGDGLAYPFATNVDVNPSTVTLSLTTQVPSYFIDVTSGPIELSLDVNSPSVSGATYLNPNKGTKSTKEIATIIARADIGQVLSNVPDYSTVLSKNRVGLELNG